ncbi:MAG: 50S ribosomal protein L1 [Halobacteriota archaeon]|nr:50S ribosomal protein L1 [Halobacteriota archaeon]
MTEDIEEAVKKALEHPERKFIESVDLVVNLKNVDMGQPQNRISEDVIIPNGHGRPIKICLFADGEIALNAKDHVDLVVPSEEIEKLAEDKRTAKNLAKEYDFFVSDAQFMPLIGRKLGPILGPRGKMPDPIPPGADIVPILSRFKRMVRVRSKDKMTFHVAIGRGNMPAKEIAENIDAVVNRLESILDRGRQNIKSIYVKTTMGEAIRLM